MSPAFIVSTLLLKVPACWNPSFRRGSNHSISAALPPNAPKLMPPPTYLPRVVMSGRMPGGLQEAHGILPDMTTLGKYVGGGMSFGAFGGKAALMEWFDPRRKDGFQHAGTFNNNVLTMNAGLIGLTEIYTPERARALNAFGEGLRERLNATIRRRGLAMQFTGIGSMIGVHMTDAPIRCEAEAAKGHAGLLDLFYFDLLARGVWFAKRGMMALSIALDAADADRLIAAVEEFAESRRPLFI